MKYKYILIIYLIAMAILFSGCVRPDPYIPPVVPNDTPNTTTVVVEEIPEIIVEDNLTRPVEVPPRKVTGFRAGELPLGEVFFYTGVGAGCMSEDNVTKDFAYAGSAYYRFTELKYPCISGTYMTVTKINTESNTASLVKKWLNTEYPDAQLSVEGEESAKIITAKTSDRIAEIVYSSSPANYNTVIIIEIKYADPQNIPVEEKTDLDRLLKLYGEAYLVYSEAQKAEYFTNDWFVLENGFYYGIGDTCNSWMLQDASTGDKTVSSLTFELSQLFYRCNTQRNHVFTITTPSVTDDMVYATTYNFNQVKSKSNLAMESINGQKILRMSKSGDYPYTLWFWHDNIKIYSFEIASEMYELSVEESDELEILLEKYIEEYPSTVSGTVDNYMHDYG